MGFMFMLGRLVLDLVVDMQIQQQLPQQMDKVEFHFLHQELIFLLQ